MPGLVPGIHVFVVWPCIRLTFQKTRMAVTSMAMTAVTFIVASCGHGREARFRPPETRVSIFREEDGSPGIRQAEATPFFNR
jgi:hypothetical protein